MPKPRGVEIHRLLRSFSHFFPCFGQKPPCFFSKVPRLPVAIRGLVTIVGNWEIKLPVYGRNVALNRNFAGAVLLIPPL